ncbi:NAD(P)-binding domain-containing protein [Methyloterricola oryzae]|uniref:NAD(P)-binding domain-containing protein n=1 Tax=Methyloterricola oryzae TaxID=1495050 RepID=UPI0005EAF02E|nr:NAD(P)-binding domain-containing protein [Methyloterricola oryzae]
MWSPFPLWMALVYAAPLILIFWLYGSTRARKQARSLDILRANEEAGLTEPVSLHPVIDAFRCIGCGTCVRACPEGDILGIIDNRAQLINPTHCIGHGACKAACPVDAISLVFGTETRGVDIPMVKPDFETNIPGIYIAGELGGMGLIRNAIEQGRQALESISQHGRQNDENGLDVLIVGAGPAGFAASLAAKERGLRFVTLEQESLGGAVFQYPRGKIVMTAPVELPLVGKVRLTETTKEALLEFWQAIESKVGLQIHYRERMESATPQDQGYLVTTNRAQYRTHSILLAIGRRGTPRKLGVSGEELPKVVYRLIDAEQYRGRRVLVVGGGDSALEAAAVIAEQPDTEVTLSYRGDAFSRAREANRSQIQELERLGRLSVLMPSELEKITADTVHVQCAGRSREIPNDAVIVCAGGVLPTEFLTGLGIAVETKFGTP